MAYVSQFLSQHAGVPESLRPPCQILYPDHDVQPDVLVRTICSAAEPGLFIMFGQFAYQLLLVKLMKWRFCDFEMNPHCKRWYAHRVILGSFPVSKILQTSFTKYIHNIQFFFFLFFNFHCWSSIDQEHLLFFLCVTMTDRWNLWHKILLDHLQ